MVALPRSMRQTLGTGTLKGAVTTTIERDFALIDMRDVIHHGIQEVPVVRDQQQGAGIVLEKIFEPQDGVEVQVVGRFIEQQQVGGAHQGLRQVQTHAPAAGKVGDRAIHLLVREAQTGKHFARARIGGVAVGAVQFGVQARLGRAVFVGLGFSQIVLHLAQTLVAIEHVINRDAIEGVDFLPHVGDPPVGREQTVPGIRRQLTQQQGEQSGFTGAIGADQTGFVAGVQGQLGVF